MGSGLGKNRKKKNEETTDPAQPENPQGLGGGGASQEDDALRAQYQQAVEQLKQREAAAEKREAELKAKEEQLGTLASELSHLAVKAEQHEKTAKQTEDQIAQEKLAQEKKTKRRQKLQKIAEQAKKAADAVKEAQNEEFQRSQSEGDQQPDFDAASRESLLDAESPVAQIPKQRRRNSLFAPTEESGLALTVPPPLADDFVSPRQPAARDEGLAEAPPHVVQRKTIRIPVISSLQDSTVHIKLKDDVYPRLVSDASRRGVSLVFVDFRLDMESLAERGLETAEAQVATLDLLLKEVARSSPFFIGLIAEVYGNPIGAEVCSGLVKRGYSWLEVDGMNSASVEDILIRRFLQCTETTSFASFFLDWVGDSGGAANPVDLENVELATMAQREAWSKELKEAGAEQEAEGGKGTSMDALHAMIANCPVVLCQGERQMAERVYTDVRHLLDRVFPVDLSDGVEVPKPPAPTGWYPTSGNGWWREKGHELEFETMAAYQRWWAAGYVEVPSVLQQIFSEHAHGRSNSNKPLQPLACLDETDGSTSSAFLAIWAKTFEEEQDAVKVVYHRFGLCSRGGASTPRELLLLISAIKRKCQILLDLPPESECKQALKDWMRMAGAHTQIVLILDGLELLSDKGGELSSGLRDWLPEQLPPGCSVILGVGDTKSTGFLVLKRVRVSHQAHHAPILRAPSNPEENGIAKTLSSPTARFQRAAARGQNIANIQKSPTRALKPVVSNEELEAIKTGISDPGPAQETSMWQQFAIEENEGMWILPLWGPSVEEIETTLQQAVQARAALNLEDHDVEGLDQWNQYVAGKLGRSADAKDHGSGAMHVAVAAISVASGLPVNVSRDREGEGDNTQSHKNFKNFKTMPAFTGSIKSKAKAGAAGSGANVPDRSLWDDLEQIVGLVVDCAAESVRDMFGDHQVMQKEVLLLLCTAYIGANEPMLQASVPLTSLPALFLFLEKLQPLMINAGGLLCPTGPLRRYIAKRYSNSQPTASLYSSLRVVKAPPGGGAALQRRVVMRCPAEVPAFLEKFRTSTDVNGLKAAVCNIEVFILAFHSIYFNDYLALWNQLSATNGSELSVNLRISGERYVRTLGVDGNVLKDGDIFVQVRLVHLLQLCGFLIDVARFPDQAQVLLETILEPALKEASASMFTVAVVLERSKVLAETSSRHSALRKLAAALNAEPQAAELSAPGRGQLWRETAFVKGFLDNAHLCAWRCLGELSQGMGQLKEAERSYGEFMRSIEAGVKEHNCLELVRARGLFATAKLLRDELKFEEAMTEAEEARHVVETQLHKDSELAADIAAFIESLLHKVRPKNFLSMNSSFGMDDGPSMQDAGNEDVEEEEEDTSVVDVSLVPGLLAEFERHYKHADYRLAQAKVSKAVKALEANARDTGGTLKDNWVHASLRFTQVLRRRGLYDLATTILQRVADHERKQTKDDLHLRVLEPLLEKCVLLLDQGSYSQAKHIIDKFPSWELTSRLDSQHPLVARKEYVEGYMAMLQGNTKEAIQYFKAAIETQEARLPPMDDKLLASKEKLMESRFINEEAQNIHEQMGTFILEVEKTYGKNAYDLAKLWGLQGHFLLAKADYRGSDDAFRESERVVLACIGKVKVDGQIVTHPLSLRNLGGLAEKSRIQGRYDDAKHMYNNVMNQLFTSRIDINHSLIVAGIKEGYAQLLNMQGKINEAQIYLTEAYTTRREVPNHDPISLFNVQVILAMESISNGRLRDAQEYLDNLSIIRERSKPLPKGKEADYHMVLGQLSFIKDVDLENAEECMNHAIQVRTEQLGASHPSVAFLQLLLAPILMEMRRMEDVEQTIKAAGVNLQIAYGRKSAHMSSVLRIQGLILRDQGSYEKAWTVLQEALDIDVSNRDWTEAFMGGDYDRHGITETLQVAEDLEALGRVQYRRGNYQIADHMLERMRLLVISIFGDKGEHPMIARAYVGLADIRLEAGKYPAAHDLCKYGLEMQLKILGNKHPHVLRTMYKYARILELCGDHEQALKWCNDTKDGWLYNLSPTDTQVLIVQAHIAMLRYILGENKLPKRAIIKCLIAVESDLAKRGTGVHALPEEEEVHKALDGGKKGKKGKAKPTEPKTKMGTAAERDDGQKHTSVLAIVYWQLVGWMASVDLVQFQTGLASARMRMSSEAYRRMGPVGVPLAGECMTTLGAIAAVKGRQVVAKQHFEKALDVKQGSFWGLEHPEILEDIQGLVGVFVHRAEYKEAERCLQQAENLTRNRLSGRNSRLGRTYLAWAELNLAQGEYSEASERLDGAKVLKIGHSNISPLSIEILVCQGSLDAARGLHEAAKFSLSAASHANHYTPKHPQRCAIFCEFAGLAIKERDAKTAVSRLKTAAITMDGAEASIKHLNRRKHSDKLKMFTVITRVIQSVIPLHPIRAKLMYMQAMCDLLQRKLESAEKLFKELHKQVELSFQKEVADNRHPIAGLYLTGLAKVYFARGEYTRAWKTFSQASAAKERGNWNSGHTSIADDMEGLGHIEWIQGMYVDAVKGMEDALIMRYEASDSVATVGTVEVELSIAGMALEQGHYHDVYEGREASLWTRTGKVALLNQVWFLHGIGEGKKEERKALFEQAAEECEAISFEDGDTIAEVVVGDTISMLVIGRGSACVENISAPENGVKTLPGGAQKKDLQQGDTFGEIFLLTGTSDSSRLVATSDGDALKISFAAMQSLLQSSANAVQVAARAIAHNQQNGEDESDYDEKAIAQVVEKIKSHLRLEHRDVKKKKNKAAKAKERMEKEDGEGGQEQRAFGKHVDRLLTSAKELTGEDSLLMAEALFLSATLASMENRLLSSITVFEKAFSMSPSLSFGSPYFSGTRMVAEFCGVLLRSGKPAQASEFLVKATKIAGEMYPEGHPETIYTNYAAACLHLHTGESSKANRYIADAVLLAKKYWLANTPRTGAMLSVLAQVQLMRGNYADSRRMLVSAIDCKFKGGWVDYHLSIADDRENLAKALAASGAYEEADEQLELAGLIRGDVAVEGSEQEAALLSCVAERSLLLSDQGFLEVGSQVAAKVFEFKDQADLLEVDFRPLLIKAHMVTSRYLHALGKHEEALEEIQSAFQSCKDRFAMGHPLCVEAALACVKELIHEGSDASKAEASELLATASSSLSDLQGPLHPIRHMVKAAASHLQASNWKFLDAIQGVEDAMQGMQATFQLSSLDSAGLEENFIIAQLHLDLADFCCSAGLYGKSTAALRSFYTIVDALFSEDDADTISEGSQESERSQEASSGGGLTERYRGQLTSRSNASEDGAMPRRSKKTVGGRSDIPRGRRNSMEGQEAMEMLGMAAALNRNRRGSIEPGTPLRHTRRGSMEGGSPLHRNRRGSMEPSQSVGLDIGRTRRSSVEGGQGGYRAARRSSMEGGEALPPRARRLSMTGSDGLSGNEAARRTSIQGSDAIRARRNSIELSPRRIRRPSIDGAPGSRNLTMTSPRRVRKPSAEMGSPRSKLTAALEASPRGQRLGMENTDANAAKALGLSFLDLQKLQAQAAENEKRNQRRNSAVQEVDNENDSEISEPKADFRIHLLDFGEDERSADAPTEPIPAVVEFLEQTRQRLQDGAESMLGTEEEGKIPADENNAIESVNKSQRIDSIVITHQKNLLGRTGGPPKGNRDTDGVLNSPRGRGTGPVDSTLGHQNSNLLGTRGQTKKSPLRTGSGSSLGLESSLVRRSATGGESLRGSPLNGVPRATGSPKTTFRQWQGLESPYRYACLRLVELRAGKVQAELLVRMAKYKEAMQSIEQLVHSLTELELKNHPLGWECRVLKGYCLCGQGNYEKAAATFEACIASVNESQSINVRLAARTTGLCYRGLGLIREVLQDFLQAAHWYNEANSAISSTTEAFAHPDIIQDDLLALRARWKAGLLDEPVEAFEDAIKRLADVLGSDHPNVSVAKMDLGDLLLSMSKLDEAEALFSPSREALSRTCGKHHPLFGRVSSAMAKIAELRGRSGKNYPTVVTTMDLALNILVRPLGTLHADLYPALCDYIFICSSRGMMDRAQEFHIWAIEILAATHGSSSPLVDLRRNEFVTFLISRGRFKQAHEVLETLLHARESSHGFSSPILCPILLRIAGLDADQLQDLEGAVEELLRSLSIKEVDVVASWDEKARLHALYYPKAPPLKKQNYDVGCCPELMKLGQVYAAMEEFTKAEKYMRDAVDAYRTELDEAIQAETNTHKTQARQGEQARARVERAKLDLAESKRAIACLHAEKGNLSEAQDWYEQALKELTAVHGREHPKSLAVKAALAGLLRGEEAYIESQRLYR